MLWSFFYVDIGKKKWSNRKYLKFFNRLPWLFLFSIFLCDHLFNSNHLFLLKMYSFSTSGLLLGLHHLLPSYHFHKRHKLIELLVSQISTKLNQCQNLENNFYLLADLQECGMWMFMPAPAEVKLPLWLQMHFFFLSRTGLELGGLVIIRSFSYLFYGSFLTLYHMKKHLVGFHASENQGEKLVW